MIEEGKEGDNSEACVKQQFMCFSAVRVATSPPQASQIAKRPICLSDVTKALSSLHSLASSRESEDTDRGRDSNSDEVCEIS